MNKKECNKFVKKAIGNELKIKIKVMNKKDGYGATIRTYPDYHEIEIDKRELYPDFEAKGTLLHELGHLFYPSNLTSSPSKLSKSIHELNAQLWAIDKAKQLKLEKVRKFLNQDILSWKKRFKNIYRYRTYVEAANLFSKIPRRWK